MQAKLSVDGAKDLYAFWGGQLAEQLATETDLVLNLASKEYSRAVEFYLPQSVRFLTCSFGEWKDGKLIEKGTICKMARGQMVRWLAEHRVEEPEDIRAFADLEYRFCAELSEKNHFVFVKRPAHKTRGLLWEFVGGKVEPGETKEQALINCGWNTAVAGAQRHPVDYAVGDSTVCVLPGGRDDFGEAKAACGELKDTEGAKAALSSSSPDTAADW